MMQLTRTDGPYVCYLDFCDHYTDGRTVMPCRYTCISKPFFSGCDP